MNQIPAGKNKRHAERQLRGIFDVRPEDKDYEDIALNARRKLARPLSPAMQCTTSQQGTQCTETRVETLRV